MPRKRTPSFIVELPLHIKPADERACVIMLRAAQNVYNAVLGEALKRLYLMRASASAMENFATGTRCRQHLDQEASARTLHSDSALRAFKAVERYVFQIGGRPNMEVGTEDAEE